MVATRDNEESRTTFGVGEPNDPQFTLSAAHEHAVFSTSLNPWEIQQQRVQPRDGIAPTISAADKRYGAIQSLVLDNEVKAAGFSFGQSEKARSMELGDCAGSVSAEMGTHQQTFVKAFSFDSMASNSMKSANPHSGCREVETARTLDCFDPNPSKNQGGIAVLAVDCRNGVESEINGTLQSRCGQNLNSNSIVRTQDDSP